MQKARQLIGSRHDVFDNKQKFVIAFDIPKISKSCFGLSNRMPKYLPTSDVRPCVTTLTLKIILYQCDQKKIAKFL